MLRHDFQFGIFGEVLLRIYDIAAVAVNFIGVIGSVEHRKRRAIHSRTDFPRISGCWKVQDLDPQTVGWEDEAKYHLILPAEHDMDIAWSGRDWWG